MNLAKNKTLVGVVVGVMIVGVVMTYVPLLFAPQSPASPNSSDQTANLPSAVAATSTPTSSVPNLPAGFSGLDKENQQLNNLDSQLNQK